MKTFHGGFCGRRLFGDDLTYPVRFKHNPVTAFTPASVAGLVGYFRPDLATFSDSGLTTPVTTDGSVIGGWQNQASGVSNATQGTLGNKPTLRTNVQNSLPIIRYDGSDDFLTVTSYVTTAMTLFIIFKGQNMLAGGTAANEYLWAKSGSNVIEVSYGGGTFPTFAFTDQTTTFHLLTVKHTGTNITVYKDGVLVSTSAETAGQDLNYIGKYVSGLPFSGDIGDILLYDRALTDVNREAVEAFVLDRWGL